MRGDVRDFLGEVESVERSFPQPPSRTRLTSKPPSVVLSVTEASKLVMSYVAAVCGKGQEVNKVKEQLLQSNPVLEGECLTFFNGFHATMYRAGASSRQTGETSPRKHTPVE